MRTPSSALAAALGAPVQRPAFLVEIGFATPWRASTYATVSFNALQWTAADVRLQALAFDVGRARGTIVVGNHDGAMAALVLAEGISDKVIKIWGYDAAATATADFVQLGEARGGAAQITPTAVAIGLRGPGEYLTCPRTLVGPAAGVNTLLPAGVVLRIADNEYRLERR
ncbi:MAG TPA: hypothetical protein P5024_12590 [Burkholderiaceae bacterium]|nr:hypothetical protein [Burkholderiaceae bacterium]